MTKQRKSHFLVTFSLLFRYFRVGPQGHLVVTFSLMCFRGFGPCGTFCPSQCWRHSEIRSRKGLTMPKSRTNSTKECSEQFEGLPGHYPINKGFAANRIRKFTKRSAKSLSHSLFCGALSVPNKSVCVCEVRSQCA